MNDKLGLIISELENVSKDVRETFGHLSAEQINWKPAPESWSVAQCLEHLVKSNEMFFDDMDKIASGTRKNSLWENWSPFTSFFGRFLNKSLAADSKKFKTSAWASPPSEVDPNIVEKFMDHQSKLTEKINATKDEDWGKAVVTSPFVPVMTYRVSDGFEIFVTHEKRHFRQAKRVIETEGFPK